jgi:myo-inositol-1(or 4)-monophosphatase
MPASTSNVDLTHALRVAIRIAEAAGALLLDRSSQGFLIESKGVNGDVVTDLDVAAEKLILSGIGREFPDHQVIAEESGVSGGTGSEWTWIIDPLDGTNNLAIGLPVYAVGIVLCCNDVPMVTVLNEAVIKRTWWATRGRGAYGPEGKSIQRFAGQHDREQLLLAWTQGHDVKHDDPIAMALKLVLERDSHRVLQLWAPLIGWAMLARGDIDGIVGYHAGPLDLHAGVLLATEAGVEVVDFSGELFEDRHRKGEERSFVAARSAAMPRVLELLRRASEIEDVLPSIL